VGAKDLTVDNTDPRACAPEGGARIDRSDDSSALDHMRDGLEYVNEVLDPGLQDLAEGARQRLRERRGSLRTG
jgi:hypothetical protein